MILKEAVVAYFKVIFSHFLEELRKTTNTTAMITPWSRLKPGTYQR
jgi:hypothetical protein